MLLSISPDSLPIDNGVACDPPLLLEMSSYDSFTRCWLDFIVWWSIDVFQVVSPFDVVRRVVSVRSVLSCGPFTSS